MKENFREGNPVLAMLYMTLMALINAVLGTVISIIIMYVVVSLVFGILEGLGVQTTDLAGTIVFAVGVLVLTLPSSAFFSTVFVDIHISDIYKESKTKPFGILSNCLAVVVLIFMVTAFCMSAEIEMTGGFAWLSAVIGPRSIQAKFINSGMELLATSLIGWQSNGTFGWMYSWLFNIPSLLAFVFLEVFFFGLLTMASSLYGGSCRYCKRANMMKLESETKKDLGKEAVYKVEKAHYETRTRTAKGKIQRGNLENAYDLELNYETSTFVPEKRELKGIYQNTEVTRLRKCKCCGRREVNSYTSRSKIG